MQEFVYVVNHYYDCINKFNVPKKQVEDYYSDFVVLGKDEYNRLLSYEAKYSQIKTIMFDDD